MSELLDLTQLQVDPSVALAVPAALSKRRRLLPFARIDGEVCVACADPEDVTGQRAIRRHFSEPVRFLAADPISLAAALARTYGDEARGAARPAAEDDAVTLCNDLLRAAILRRASDLHVDPQREGVRVRLRCDGVLEDYQILETSVLAGLMSRFKVLAGMDIAEKRAPQDGRFSHDYGGEHPVELRAATLPTKYGERLTLRLLALQTESLTLERLGLAKEPLARLDRNLERPHGLILVTGPTGSGKSTTLYAGIRRLIAQRPLNVITVEDPIEFDIDGVAQVEVDSGDRVGFGRALRSMLRHDPDVIMIGEIRDPETAGVAMKAALTGHLVLSTLHTNTAPGAITRLIDMGVERYLVAATLRLVVAQRLARGLCSRCRAPRPLSAAEAAVFGAPEAEGETVYEAAGCLYCAGRGFSGRSGLFELLEMTPAWTRRVVEGADEAALIAAMRAEKVPTLTEAALRALLAGDLDFSGAASAVTPW
ncbi:MAG: type II/IV secretion system protein [Planctomycetes bacterium]|nr:type II/IV secretion system protein [Planctomycetota bacterium]